MKVVVVDYCSVAQSCLTLQHHRLQHAKPPCPSPSPKVCPSSCLLQRWCHPATSSSDVLFSFCPQSFPASGTFQWVVCLHQITKYWNFSFSISPSHQCSVLISFSIDWFDLLVSLFKENNVVNKCLFLYSLFILTVTHVGLLCFWRVGTISSCCVWAPHRGGFSWCRAWAPEHRLSSCGAWA